jgi:uncharacterized protein (TIGR00661 family)
MASIVYSICGEGRGHATRARAVVEGLRAHHQVTLFASGCAHDMLADYCRETGVGLFHIPGLHFEYTRRGRVALLRTVSAAAGFKLAIGRYVRAVQPTLERLAPDLVVADFEPILPRAARRMGVPFVSFDHQHYLVVSDLSALPAGLRQRAALAAPFVRALYDWQIATIVSSFYAPPLKEAYTDTTLVGTLIRPEIAGLRPERGRHLVAYIRRQAAPDVLEALRACGREVRLYGLGPRPAEGNLRFLAVDERRFVDDLASCDAVVSTAGNQLVGEALYLGKPMLVLPEARNFEQAVNAHFLEQSGAGWAESGRLEAERVGAFLEQREAFRAAIHPDRIYGNKAAVRALERALHRTGERTPPRALLPAARGIGRELWA